MAKGVRWPWADHKIHLFYKAVISFMLQCFFKNKRCSHFFIGVSKVPVKLIALALLTSMSIPPNVFTASCTALLTAFSSRISTAQGRHFPPASSTVIKYVNNNCYTSWLGSLPSGGGEGMGGSGGLGYC